MKNHALLSVLGAAMLIGAATACSDATSPSSSATASLDANVTADLATSAGEDASAQYEFLSGVNTVGLGGTFAQGSLTGLLTALNPAYRLGRFAHWISAQCTYTDASQSFECPSVQRANHTFDISYQLFDSMGTPQSAYDTVLTASATFTVQDTVALAHSRNDNTFSDTAGWNKTFTVSGLQGNPDTVHVWNATGSGHVSAVRTGWVNRTYTLTASDTATDVRIQQPWWAHRYPLSGTIVLNYSGMLHREAPGDTLDRSTVRRVVVTFNGTANVPMTIGDTQFMLNLDTHAVTKQTGQ